MSHPESPLPLLPLRHGVVLPGRVTTIPVGRPRSRALADALRPGDRVLLAVQRDPSQEDPSLADLHPIATLARVTDKTDRGSRGVILVVEPTSRYRLISLLQTVPYWTARAELAEETSGGDEAQILATALRDHLRELAPGDSQLHELLRETRDPAVLADRVAAWMDTDDAKKTEVLLQLDVTARLRRVAELINEARAKAELRSKIDGEVRKELGKHQKEAMLRQQLRAIQKELGEGDDKDELREKLDAMELPEEVREVVDRELRRLDQVGPNQAEGNVIRTYLQWIADLPWTDRAPASSDIDAVAQKLEEDHYGLDDVKRRILEHMAVLKLSGASSNAARGTILCLVGPPGVGKTSLAQSVAAATGRPLQRVSLGGVRDEAEIRGHRRTYIGALPGRLIAAMRKAKVKNPVIVLDEIDKMGRGWQGDPEAALLEVLDPEQNKNFTDHYMELPFDLSEVLFIATANDLSTLSAPLRDRLEIIEVTGYTAEEKVQIAHRHLVPQQLVKAGMPEKSVLFADEILAAIVRDYTREAGVRQLAREIQKVARSVALDVARAKTDEHGEREAVTVTSEHLKKSLGKPRFLSDMAERGNAPGIAAGLAWTPVGGDILYIETTKMPGKGRLEITGQLGDVMKESARAALAYLRSRADEYGVDPEFLEKHDLHIHVPAGAIPKDGPSAGVTMFTALASLLTGRRVRSDVAMTGEATLRGRVLPIGGVKSKVLAAHRAGFKRVILPKLNERDIDDVPESVRGELEFVIAEEMREVLAAALEPDPVAVDAGPTTPSTPKGGGEGAVIA
ncbi:endopeptidase La [Sandaracinus amylolyticus]|uniref:endopeptidase La n=1 Tax=Sandaracinus amylolyticus TaxID=927083 RepID=UPI0009467F49|nr:endopeptidase La [Sandaracinus amylolyticus]